jgi:hypothetical protein
MSAQLPLFATHVSGTASNSTRPTGAISTEYVVVSLVIGSAVDAGVAVAVEGSVASAVVPPLVPALPVHPASDPLERSAPVQVRYLQRVAAPSESESFDICFRLA